MLAPLVACIVALALYPGLILSRGQAAVEDKVAAVASSSEPAAPNAPSVRAESGWTGYAPLARRRRPMSFTAPEVDYAGLSPVIALTAGICVVLLAGLVGERRQRLVVSTPLAGHARDRRRAVHLAVGRAQRTWWREPCGSTSSAWPPP